MSIDLPPKDASARPFDLFLRIAPDGRRGIVGLQWCEKLETIDRSEHRTIDRSVSVPGRPRCEREEATIEYGDAISSAAFDKAVAHASQLHLDRGKPLVEAAWQAVAKAYCVCVTDGEDAAEKRLSGVHRQLIDDVAERVRQLERDRSHED